MLFAIIADAAAEPSIGVNIDPGAMKIIIFVGIIALGAFIWSQRNH